MRHPLILLAIAAMTLACAGVPGTRPTYRVVSVELVGPLIDATLEWTSRAAPVSSDRLRSLLFPDIESCRALLQEGAEVEYVPGGLTGSISKDGHTCDAVGISDLVQWRDRRVRDDRSRAFLGGTRQQATYRIVADQEAYAIVRGRFPLAAWIGWVGGEDSLALIPKGNEVCGRVLARSVASIEYLPAGKRALVLIDDGQCPIRGFARVVPALKDS